jgi:hypothetical protein
MEKIRLFAGILHASETSSKVSCRLCTAEVRGSNRLGSTLIKMDTSIVVQVAEAVGR